MKFRQFSIVFHNVDRNKCYQVLGEYVVDVKEYVLSCEDYPQGGGTHAHLFVQYKNQRSFKSVLKELEVLKKKFITPRPPGEERDWGRVQLDVMKGRFKQAEAYLLGETKDKPTGQVLSGAVKPCNRRFRWKIVNGKTVYEEFCGFCDSNVCCGCCKGCMFCDPNDRFYSWLYTGEKDEFAYENVRKRMEKTNEKNRKKYLRR